MTVRSGTCDLRRLDLFLRQRLPKDAQQELEAHLLVCPACRNQLDELAGGGRWWSEVRRYLSSDGVSGLSQTSDQTAPRRVGPVDLDFLTPSDHPASLGRLGTYEILEVLGRGGWGIVLKAFDPALHRPVAIKVLAAEYAAHGAARKRFAREAQAAAAVSHDHVVAVYAVDADATPPYLVMAFISGQSLQQRLDQSGPLELKEILRIGMQTASGLAAAHAQGLVHRDIKPANIMLENGIERVRITDFGLARAVDDASVSQHGAVAGTPQYMAPEQARGEAVDQRADLFALGSTLYAMCAGQAPFRGDFGLAVIRQVADVEPTPIRSLNPEIPLWLVGIIRKLHAKDPAQRFQSAAEVADLLERCLAHVQQPDCQPLPPLAEELGRQVPGPTPRRRARPWLVAATVFLAGVLGGVLWYVLPRPAETQTTSETSADTNRPAGEETFFTDDFRQGTNQLQSRPDELQQPIWVASPGKYGGLEPALSNMRQRTAKLRDDLDASEPTFDPVAAQLEAIRQRLNRLWQDLGRQAH
jgi:serine/threonine-protein kinase